MSYRLGFLILVGVFVLHFSRILFLGEVIFSHDNAPEVGALHEDTDARISNCKFSDRSSVFIPERANNLGTNHKAWLNIRELSFRPFLLWAWLPQLLFVASGALLLFRAALPMSGRPES